MIVSCHSNLAQKPPLRKFRVSKQLTESQKNPATVVDFPLFITDDAHVQMNSTQQRVLFVTVPRRKALEIRQKPSGERRRF
jgi:hypothetical protein